MDQGCEPCRGWWTRSLRVCADAQPDRVEKTPSCSQLLTINRECTLQKDEAHGHDTYKCTERRDVFLVCSGERQPQRLSSTIIETKEPIIEGHGVARAPPSGNWRLWRPHPDDVADASTSPGPVASPTTSSLGGFYERRLSPGRRPWDVRADDGAGDGAPQQGPSTGLPPQVGQAVEEIFQFADEMQRDLEQQGYVMLKRAEASQRRRPGFFARLLGARTAEESIAGGEGSSSSSTGGGRAESSADRFVDPLTRFGGVSFPSQDI